MYWRAGYEDPDSTVLGVVNSGNTDNACQDCVSQVVHMCHRQSSSLHHCDIEPTVASHDDDVNTITRETVYVGLYPPSGGNQLLVPSILLTIIILLWYIDHGM